MTCETFMLRDPPTLRADATLSEALTALHCNRMFALPVVDGEGRYVGLFDVRQMMKLLLPKAVTINHGLDNLGWMRDTASTWRELKQRLDQIGDDPVAEHLSPEVPVIHPDTSVVETLRNLYLHPNIVPVVERDSGRLLGIATSWDAMAEIPDGHKKCPT